MIFSTRNFNPCGKSQDKEDAAKLSSGYEEVTTRFMVHFISFLYGHKFSPLFDPGQLSSLVIDLRDEELLETIRKATWHKTVSSNNTVPSLSAIRLHAKRLMYVLNSFGNATVPELDEIDSENFGWMVVTADNK